MKGWERATVLPAVKLGRRNASYYWLWLCGNHFNSATYLRPRWYASQIEALTAEIPSMAKIAQLAKYDRFDCMNNGESGCIGYGCFAEYS